MQFGVQPILQKLYVPKDVASSSVVFVTEATKTAVAAALIVLDGQVWQGAAQEAPRPFFVGKMGD
jgi:hypothetical protein